MRLSVPIYLLAITLIASNANANSELLSAKQADSVPSQLTPIKNAAELEARIRQGLAPFEALTPFGRRDFLRGLTWGSKGLGTLSVNSMMRELSAEQIIALARVFDAERYVQSLLSKAAAYPPLRLNDTSAEREAHYFALMDKIESERGIIDSEAGTSRQDFEPLIHEFNRRFGQDLLPNNMEKMSDGDLVLLFDSVTDVAFISLDPKFTAQQQQIYEVLQSRGIDTRRDINQRMLQTMLHLRQFDQARAFISTHPDLHDTKIPNVDDRLGSDYQGRSVYAYDPEANTLTRQSLAFANGKQLVMVVNSGCEFSRRALAAINDDGVFAQAVREAKLVILTPPASAPPLFFLQQWNAKHPDFVIRVAASRSEWRDIDEAVPIFYIYEDGKLLKVIEGWQGQKTRDLLLQNLAITKNGT